MALIMEEAPGLLFLTKSGSDGIQGSCTTTAERASTKIEYDYCIFPADHFLSL
jgi:hypothetical protein